MQNQLNRLHYGNCNISQWNGTGANSIKELNGFWLGSSLKISPQEQVQVLKNIFESKTDYTKEQLNLLKSIMLLSDKNHKQIYGKTGTANGNTNGQFVGVMQTIKGNVYFAIYLEGKQVSGKDAQEIALSILK